tara:strand:+ start:166 stop:1731 length:1566 start_codon:yes stop_codon:yes gene_type:complete
MKRIHSITIACLLFVFTFVQAQEKAVKKPNFLVILTDDQRMDALTCYNADLPIKTPSIDKIAQSGIRFTNGFVTTPICVVSRASIQTGRYETNARLHHFQTPMDDDVFYDSYPVHLRKAGYFTGALGKYGVGITDKQKEEFDVFNAQTKQGPTFRNYKGKRMHDSEWLSVKTEEFLDTVPENQVFCLQVNYKEPHNSSVPAPEDDEALDHYMFERSPMDSPEEYAKLPEHVKNGFGRVCYFKDYLKGGDYNLYLRQYHEKIMSVERSVGEILQMLEERNLADNTVIIFLSDHGTHWGEKQLSGKWTPYDLSLRIPFIVYDPRPKAIKTKVSDEMVLNIDIAPTLLDMAGIPVPETMDGKSLVPLIYNKKAKWRDHFFYEHFTSLAPIRYIPRNVGVRTQTAKYVRWIDMNPPVEEYFDLTVDSDERTNLISNPEYKNQIVAARNLFDNWRTDNPSTYAYDVYGSRPQFGAKDIDWEKFKEVRPKEYEKIKAAFDSMEVTWEQALDDWEIRSEICLKTKYWY